MSERPTRSHAQLSALDELRFGPTRTLNLRESLPSAADAVRRTENFLREHQIAGTDEVLVITGRGNQSPDGIGVLRPAVEKLLYSLRRRGVVAAHTPHNPGAFVVRLAPVRALADAVPRNKDRRRAPIVAPDIVGLSDDTNRLLHTLAEHALAAVGVRPDAFTIEDEMHRQLRALAPSLPGGAAMEPALRRALAAAIADYD